MKRQLLLTVLIALVTAVWAQGPNGSEDYYKNADGYKGAALKTALSGIIHIPNGRNVGYDGLYEGYKKTDTRPDGYVRDWYSNTTNYVHVNDKAGHYSAEGDCYNREHSVPQSWFGGGGIKSDIIHVLPTDGYVNNRRSNYPFGEVGNIEYKSNNSYSKLGSCKTTGYSGTVFEPNDEIKGDIARIYFHMVTCYEVLAPAWGHNVFSTAYNGFEKWALDMLMRWSKEDPVDEREIARNNAVFEVQGNRNPFVDYPGLEDYIWGDKKELPFGESVEPEAEPTSDNCETALNKEVLGVDWSATENLCDYWKRTPVVFEKDGITFTYSFGMEGKNLYADENEIRLYNYNTLTLTAHNKDLTKVELTVTGQNHDSKTLVASVGELEDNVWTGTAKEVIFASNYVSSNKVGGVTIHYYLGLSNVKITVDDPSGIEEIHRAIMVDGRIYNLMGVVMDEGQLKPGIYIKNGRKFIVK